MTATAQFNTLRDALGILSQSYSEDQIKVSAVCDAMVLTTDDREARWALQLEAEVSDPGDFCVSFRRFLAHFQAFDGGQVVITDDQQSVSLTRDSVIGILAKADMSLFPQATKLSSGEVVKKIKCDQASFTQAVSACASISAEVPGYRYTSGLCVSVRDGQGHIFATDRKQVIRIGFKCSGDDARFTLDVAQLRRVVAMEGDVVEIENTPGSTRLKNEYFMAVLANFQHDAPDVGMDFVTDAREGKHRVRIPVPFLLEALQLAKSVGGQRPGFFCYLDLGLEDCRIRAIGERQDEINVSLRCQAEHPAKIFINHLSLLKSLATFHRLGLCAQYFELLYSTPRSALFVPFTDDCDSLFVTMPIVPPGIDLDQVNFAHAEPNPATV